MKKFIKIGTVAIAASILLTGCGSTSTSTGDSDKVYKIACDQSYAPFDMKEDDGTYTGIDMDIISAISQLEDFEYELVPMDFSGCIPALTSDTVDAVLAGMTITEERKEIVDFSDPYYDSTWALTVNKDNDSINSLEDLAGTTAACKEGTVGQIWCTDNADKYGFNIATFPDSVTMMIAVSNNQADFLIEDYPVMAYQIKIGVQDDLKVAIDSIADVSQYGFAVNKDKNQELLAKFNAGLKTIKENGTYDDILNNYK